MTVLLITRNGFGFFLKKELIYEIACFCCSVWSVLPDDASLAGDGRHVLYCFGNCLSCGY